MKVYNPGTTYGLEDPISGGIQTVSMMRDGFPGTTNEEVLEMMIHRLETQSEDQPCKENSNAIRKITEAKMWLEERARRVAGGKAE